MMISEEEKNLKYLWKNYRYRIRGPIRYPPPYISKEKKKKMIMRKITNKRRRNDLL